MVRSRLSSCLLVVGLALGLPQVARAQCLSDKLVDENLGILNFAGSTVDIGGSLAVLGAPNVGSDARILIFLREEPEVWTEEAEIVSPEAAQDDGFGRAVAIAGSYVAVGAQTTDLGADTDAGAVYVYRRAFLFGNPVWLLDATINNPSPDDDDRFGTSVDLAIIDFVPTLAIGAPGEDVPGANQGGRVRIYVRTGGTWTLQTP